MPDKVSGGKTDLSKGKTVKFGALCPKLAGYSQPPLYQTLVRRNRLPWQSLPCSKHQRTMRNPQQQHFQQRYNFPERDLTDLRVWDSEYLRHWGIRSYKRIICRKWGHSRLPTSISTSLTNVSIMQSFFKKLNAIPLPALPECTVYLHQFQCTNCVPEYDKVHGKAHINVGMLLIRL